MWCAPKSKAMDFEASHIFCVRTFLCTCIALPTCSMQDLPRRQLEMWCHPSTSSPWVVAWKKPHGNILQILPCLPLFYPVPPPCKITFSAYFHVSMFRVHIRGLFTWAVAEGRWTKWSPWAPFIRTAGCRSRGWALCNLTFQLFFFSCDSIRSIVFKIDFLQKLVST